MWSSYKLESFFLAEPEKLNLWVFHSSSSAYAQALAADDPQRRLYEADSASHTGQLVGQAGQVLKTFTTWDDRVQSALNSAGLFSSLVSLPIGQLNDANISNLYKASRCV